MRVISQDGQCDLPYDAMVIEVDSQYKNKIAARAWMSVWYIAEYSTPQKAMKAMEMLRSVYRKCIKASSEYCDAIRYYDFPKVFQFPQDDEIEEDEKND